MVLFASQERLNMISVLVLCLMASITTQMSSSEVFQCDEYCADKPVFSPSRLVVEYGGPASFRCTACQHDCQLEQTGLTVLSGDLKKDGNMILWKNINVTDWDLFPTCYYAREDGSHCCSHLPVTLYKPPEFVLIYLVKNIDETQEDQYSLQCVVHDVAPIENVIVTFYKRKNGLNQTLGQIKSNIKDKTPVTKTFKLKSETIEEDDENQYWCEAKLDLGLQGTVFPLIHASGFTESKYTSVTADGCRMIYSLNLCLMLLVYFVI